MRNLPGIGVSQGERASEWAWERERDRERES